MLVPIFNLLALAIWKAPPRLENSCWKFKSVQSAEGSPVLINVCSSNDCLYSKNSAGPITQLMNPVKGHINVIEL